MTLALFVLLLALQIADYASTRAVMAKGGIEANPLVRKLGLLPSKLLVGALAVPLYLYDAPAGLGLLAVLYLAVVAQNLRVLKAMNTHQG